MRLLEAEEKEWMIALLEDGKIVHDAKISFPFDEINRMLDQQKVILISVCPLGTGNRRQKDRDVFL